MYFILFLGLLAGYGLAAPRHHHLDHCSAWSPPSEYTSLAAWSEVSASSPSSSFSTSNAPTILPSSVGMTGATSPTSVGDSTWSWTTSVVPSPTSISATSSATPPVISTLYTWTLSSMIASSSTTKSSTSTSSWTSSIASYPTYGSVVDVADSAPNPSTLPSALPKRADGNLTIVGSYSAPFQSALAGDYDLFFQHQYVNISGTGYFFVDWEIGFGNQVPGQLSMPSWSNLKGKLFHVASGGGRRMTDHRPQYDSWCKTTGSWMGCPGDRLDTVPAGALQMWQLEWYWLDGSVMLSDTENAVDYNLAVSPKTWQDVTDDINNPINVSNEILRYGLVRDTGDDTAPVPQYCTNAAFDPNDYAGLTSVGQVSDVKYIAP